VISEALYYDTVFNNQSNFFKVFTSKHEETQMLRSKNAPPLGGAFLAVIA
jgi:hypothetical protein